MHAAALSALPLPIQVHLILALVALVLGPVALYARKGSLRHRWAGRVWVVVMLGVALSALFIRDFRMPNLAGYTWIHLFVPATLIGLGAGVWLVLHGRIAAHRLAMRRTYIGGCLVAGAFTLLPGRYLGDLIWHHTLGLVG